MPIATFLSYLGRQIAPAHYRHIVSGTCTTDNIKRLLVLEPGHYSELHAASGRRLARIRQNVDGRVPRDPFSGGRQAIRADAFESLSSPRIRLLAEIQSTINR